MHLLTGGILYEVCSRSHSCLAIRLGHKPKCTCINVSQMCVGCNVLHIVNFLHKQCIQLLYVAGIVLSTLCARVRPTIS